VAVASAVGCEVVAGIHDKVLAGGTGVPCAQQQSYLFCDDFDSVDDASIGWLWDTPEGGASIEIDPNDFRTAPHSVKVYVPTSSPQAQLGKTLDASITQSVSLEFDLRVDVTQDQFDAIPEVSLAQILLLGNNTSINYIVGGSSPASVYAYDTTNSGWHFSQRVQPPPLGTWTHIALAYDATTGLTLTEDGTTLYADGPDAAVARGTPGTTDVIVGAVYVNLPGTAALQVEIDDVVARGQ
jgi:hypothetical protein